MASLIIDEAQEKEVERLTKVAYDQLVAEYPPEGYPGYKFPKMRIQVPTKDKKRNLEVAFTLVRSPEGNQWVFSEARFVAPPEKPKEVKPPSPPQQAEGQEPSGEPTPSS